MTACLFVGMAGSTAAAQTVGWDDDDFLVAGISSFSIGVYDADLTFKGNLAVDFPQVTALDFDATGRLVASGATNDEVRVFESDGSLVSSFTDPAIGSPVNIKVLPSGNYLVGTGQGLREFTPEGELVRELAAGVWQGVAVLPVGIAWGGGYSLRAFDVMTGELLPGSLLDNGQSDAVSMMFSAETQTVLMTDRGGGAAFEASVFERSTDGTFVRELDAPGFDRSFGVTRGPKGEIFATDLQDDGIYRWSSDGSYLGFTDLSASLDNPYGIVWAGNSVVPEPGAAGCLFSVATFAALRRRRLQGR